MWCENFSIYCYWLHWHWSWPSWWRWHHQTSNWFMVLFSACYESRVFKEVVIVIISNVGSCHVLSWCLTHSRPSLISHQNQSIWSEKNQNWCDILWKLKRTTLWCYVVGWKSSSVEGGQRDQVEHPRHLVDLVIGQPGQWGVIVVIGHVHVLPDILPGSHNAVIHLMLEAQSLIECFAVVVHQLCMNLEYWKAKFHFLSCKKRTFYS